MAAKDRALGEEGFGPFVVSSIRRKFPQVKYDAGR
jgi:hypothetical protein